MSKKPAKRLRRQFWEALGDLFLNTRLSFRYSSSAPDRTKEEAVEADRGLSLSKCNAGVRAYKEADMASNPLPSAFGRQASQLYLCTELFKAWFFKSYHPLPMTLNDKRELFMKHDLRQYANIHTLKKMDIFISQLRAGIAMHCRA